MFGFFVFGWWFKKVCKIFGVSFVRFIFAWAHSSQVGCGPTATSFLCFRQRMEAKKGDHAATALRVPYCAGQKMGKLRNSLRSNNEAFFIHFLSCTIGSIRSGWRSKATATPKQSIPTVINSSNNSCRSLFLTLFLTYPRLRRCNLCFTENG